MGKYYTEVKRITRPQTYLETVFEMALGRWDSALSLLSILGKTVDVDSEDYKAKNNLMKKALTNQRDNKLGLFKLEILE